MAAKAVKLGAVPTVLGLASLRVYAINQDKTEELRSPRELSVYSPPVESLRYVEERPGLLQRGLGTVRLGLRPYVRAVKGVCSSAKVHAVSLYHAGQDSYRYLKDPPPGFLPRVSIITVSGLAGLILSRKGSPLKRLGFPLGLASLGTALCYPAQTVGVLKLTGETTLAVSQWTSTAVASLWRKTSPIDPPAQPEDVSISSPEPIVATAEPLFEAKSAELPPIDDSTSLIPPEADSSPLDVTDPVPVLDTGSALPPLKNLLSDSEDNSLLLEEEAPIQVQVITKIPAPELELASQIQTSPLPAPDSDPDEKTAPLSGSRPGPKSVEDSRLGPVEELLMLPEAGLLPGEAAVPVCLLSGLKLIPAAEPATEEGSSPLPTSEPELVPLQVEGPAPAELVPEPEPISDQVEGPAPAELVPEPEPISDQVEGVASTEPVPEPALLQAVGPVSPELFPELAQPGSSEQPDVPLLETPEPAPVQPAASEQPDVPLLETPEPAPVQPAASEQPDVPLLETPEPAPVQPAASEQPDVPLLETPEPTPVQPAASEQPDVPLLETPEPAPVQPAASEQPDVPLLETPEPAPVQPAASEQPDVPLLETPEPAPVQPAASEQPDVPLLETPEPAPVQPAASEQPDVPLLETPEPAPVQPAASEQPDVPLLETPEPAPVQPAASEQPDVPLLETPEPAPVQPAASEQPDVPLLETPEPAPETDSTAERARFSPDPRLMDHGQSSPDDADLYSTRS